MTNKLNKIDKLRLIIDLVETHRSERGRGPIGVTALDPGTFALAAALMVASTTVAAVLAARGAAVVDPAATLRAE
jgi:hypothetical protein